MKRRTVTFLLLALAAMMLAACGSQSEGAKAKSGQGAAASAEAGRLLEEIKASGKLRIGTEGTYPPFTYHDDSGKLTGFDVEIAEEVARRLGGDAGIRRSEVGRDVRGSGREAVRHRGEPGGHQRGSQAEV
ncbi:hypothetical protein J27TS7_35210 [Paenibacillus dendritiformis]|nr:hypothetical protein J27TS7_35210 [Paenibacillus dendritiformis]